MEEQQKQVIFKQMKYTNQILDIIYQHKDYTTSDLQGLVMAVVMKIIDETKKGGDNYE